MIDANAFCYRAFYALGGLSTSYGQPTGAIYGFIIFLNKILKQRQPQYLGVCFDVSRDTFRQREFAGYKIQRPAMPEDLIAQLPLIKQIIQAYKIAIYEKAGFEAEDLIASLTKKAKDKGLSVVIVSSDKDVLQLVDEETSVFNPYKGAKDVIYDPKRVCSDFGVAPAQMIDFISLAGDAADNIPSVKGIGAKTAVRLIQEYGSLAGIMKSIEKVKPQKLQDVLKESTEQLELNRRLAALRDDIELDLDLAKLSLNQPDYAALRDIFRRLEFRKLFNDLLSQEDCPKESLFSQKRANFARETDSPQALLSADGQELYLADLGQGLALMNEKTGFLLESAKGKLSAEVCAILSNPRIKKTGHNLKELKVGLAKQRVNLNGLYFDTMVAAYLLNPDAASYTFADLCWDYLKQGVSQQSISADAACALTLKLKGALQKELNAKGLNLLFSELEMPLVEVLSEMELTGVSLDLEFLKHLAAQVEGELVKLVDKIYELSGTPFNINSPQQLRTILFERLKLPIQRKAKTGPSTDEEVLTKLAAAHPLPAALLDYRRLAKIKSTYIDALPALVDPQSGRIHAAFNQTATRTGRLSSAHPNLQNLPVKGDIGRQIRKAIIPCNSDDLIVSFDYSQIELRILGHLSGDARLIEAFKNNEDIHTTTAALIYGLKQSEVNSRLRETAKRINFGIIYGLSSFGLSRDLGISPEEADTFMKEYFIRYPGVADYIQSQIEKAKEYGYVTTLLGRRSYVPEINSKNAGLRQFAQRQAVNASIQGSAADLIKKAMVEIHPQLTNRGLKSKLIIQVHDELVFEAGRNELEELVKLVRPTMEGCVKFNVPIKTVTKVGKNWLEMEVK